jgi:hypothetical protein
VNEAEESGNKVFGKKKKDACKEQRSPNIVPSAHAHHTNFFRECAWELISLRGGKTILGNCKPWLRRKLARLKMKRPEQQEVRLLKEIRQGETCCYPMLAYFPNPTC